VSEREQVQVESSGETVGEARWAALHELERRFPHLDRDAVEFVVLSEGQRGLLGVGYEPARVLASATVDPSAARTPEKRQSAPVPGESPAAARVRSLLEQIVDAMGIDGDVSIAEREGVVTATVTGSDLGLLIGKHGQTIDAIQYLTNAILHRREQGSEAVIDAQGYRKRRERTLHDVAVRAADQALRTNEPVELEPMTSVERKIIHTKVQSLGGLETASEGAEPNRFVVIRPTGV
jgi:spoIIIJ-associated protein